MAETKEKSIEIPDYISVRDLADLLETSPIDVIKLLMSNGIMAKITEAVDFETAAIVAAEMGFDPAPVGYQAEEVKDEAEDADSSGWRQVLKEEADDKLERRPPVIAVLGHVDHGKTSLLDKIRSANVQEGEAGGITQHIGAYQIEYDGRKLTFLDTPGHEAFTAMRARGAHGADIAILVVAADDGVMPQTREAISHAKAAGVPIIVAMNKIDRNNANQDFVKQQLAENGLMPDDYGGDTIVLPVSALKGEGIDDLVEAIILVADDTDIRANPKGRVAGTILEAELDKFRGVMATLLVQNGTLRKGDTVLAGQTYGRIKAMFDENGEQVDAAPPSTPVQVMGLNDVPEAGDFFEIVKSEKAARSIVDDRDVAGELSEAGSVGTPMTLEALYEKFQAGEARELNLIVKADVQGSLEPILSSLEKVSVEDEQDDTTIKVSIIHEDIGNVSESDVMLASASNAIIIGFNVVVDGAAQRRADSEGVEIRNYSVIYTLLEEIEQALQGMLKPVYEDRVIGVAEVRQVFRISKVGAIAGSYIREGEARRDARARVIRNHQLLHEGKLSSLKRFQEDAKEVRSGFECGISVDGFNDFEEGDLIQFTVRERVR